jgi:acyl carrier protein
MNSRDLPLATCDSADDEAETIRTVWDVIRFIEEQCRL